MKKEYIVNTKITLEIVSHSRTSNDNIEFNIFVQIQDKFSYYINIDLHIIDPNFINDIETDSEIDVDDVFRFLFNDEEYYDKLVEILIEYAKLNKLPPQYLWADDSDIFVENIIDSINEDIFEDDFKLSINNYTDIFTWKYDKSNNSFIIDNEYLKQEYIIKDLAESIYEFIGNSYVNYANAWNNNIDGKYEWKEE